MRTIENVITLILFTLVVVVSVSCARMSDERELFLKKLSLELQNGLGSSDLTSIVSGEVAKINEYLKKDKGKMKL